MFSTGTDHIEVQQYSQQQLNHNNTEKTVQRLASASLQDVLSSIAKKDMDLLPFDWSRSENTSLQVNGTTTPLTEQSLKDNLIPQMPLLYLPAKAKKSMSTTPELTSSPSSPSSHSSPSTPSAPSSTDGDSSSTNITPEVPRIPASRDCYPTEVMGTIIYCDGAISALRVPQFDLLAVSSFEATFHHDDSQPHIPALVGLPLWMRQHRQNDSIDQENNLARHLWISTNFDHPGFGSSAAQLGSRLLMRKDGVNLIPHHLEALCTFCISVLRESCGERGILSKTPGKSDKQKKLFKQMATQKGFETFWNEYRARKASHDARWKNLPSPYDVARLGVTYSWLVPSYATKDTSGRRGAPTRATDAVGPLTRTEGLVTRGLARKREIAGGCQRGSVDAGS